MSVTGRDGADGSRIGRAPARIVVTPPNSDGSIDVVIRVVSKSASTTCPPPASAHSAQYTIGPRSTAVLPRFSATLRSATTRLTAIGKSISTTSPFVHRRSSVTYPDSSGAASAVNWLIDSVVRASTRSAYEYNVPGTGWFRAQPGTRSLIVAGTPSRVDTGIRAFPYQRISLVTDSAI